MIAPFWDDLKPLPGDFTDVYSLYDENNGRFIIKWDTWNRYQLEMVGHSEIFILVIYDNSTNLPGYDDTIFEFHYEEIADVDHINNGATVGIQNQDHSDGLQYAYGMNYPEAATPLEAGLAIRFTTYPPESAIPVKDENGTPLPSSFKMYPVYPNPFNPSATMKFDLPSSANLRISLFDILGREVAVLMDGEVHAGQHRVVFDGSQLSSGMYFVQMEASSFKSVRKVMLLK